MQKWWCFSQSGKDDAVMSRCAVLSLSAAMVSHVVFSLGEKLDFGLPCLVVGVEAN